MSDLGLHPTLHEPLPHGVNRFTKCEVPVIFHDPQAFSSSTSTISTSPTAEASECCFTIDRNYMETQQAI